MSETTSSPDVEERTKEFEWWGLDTSHVYNSVPARIEREKWMVRTKVVETAFFFAGNSNRKPYSSGVERSHLTDSSFILVEGDGAIPSMATSVFIKLFLTVIFLALPPVKVVVLSLCIFFIVCAPRETLAGHLVGHLVFHVYIFYSCYSMW